MKGLFITLGLAMIVVVGASIFGFIGFHYPKVIQNEPLHNPQKVLRIEGPDLILQSGLTVRIDHTENATEISNKLSQSAFEIDLEGRTNGEPVMVWARQNGWICGTPWSQPIIIPLFRDTVYKNRRYLIAGGTCVKSNTQP